jgi:hypothetical protein
LCRAERAKYPAELLLKFGRTLDLSEVLVETRHKRDAGRVSRIRPKEEDDTLTFRSRLLRTRASTSVKRCHGTQ